MADGPERYTDAEAVARAIIERTGGDIRLALPLGLGKANSIANALTRAAVEDRAISLDIQTALTLQRPRTDSDLARRFLGPAGDRLFGRYPPLLYAELLHQRALPPNITVSEFFLLAGRWLDNSAVQRRYISANYTHAFRYLLAMKPNVVAHLLAADGNGQFSISCNTDITADLLKARRAGKADFIFAGETNAQLPFMDAGEALCDPENIDLLLDSPDDQFELFSVVKQPVSPQDMAIGLHVSRLVKDGGTLQIGIGSIGDAIARAMIVRHRRNDEYRALMAASPFHGAAPEDHQAPFQTGLYAVTEMLVDGILQLFEEGIVSREVDGAAVHAGFFVECRDFYERLRDMPRDRQRRIAMMPVSFTNELYGGEAQKAAARVDARFVNNAMMATCLGAIVSDALEDGRVISGVGGQFNFVSQAFALEGARAIITLNATRSVGGRAISNIRWSYGHNTVPRHYRDIVVTEYGIADLRGRTDEDCVKAMLGVADARFQDGLLADARKAGKIDAGWSIPESYRANTPAHLNEWLEAPNRNGLLPTFPFGTDFTELEQSLLPVLARLRDAQASKMRLAGLVLKGLATGSDAHIRAVEERLSLDSPRSLAERMTRLAVRGALASGRDEE
ncbi:MAG: acetyl-CoA hydrolase/transferase C-terminal domain-containing protein [Flavobacteriaceae bacterium]